MTVSTCEADVAEEVDVVGEFDPCVRMTCLVATSGRKNGRAERVAVDRWWLACRTHVRRTDISGSGSVI